MASADRSKTEAGTAPRLIDPEPSLYAGGLERLRLKVTLEAAAKTAETVASQSRPGLRVLVVQPTCDKMGHYGLYTVRLCQALGQLGHSVTLCTNNTYPERYLDSPQQFEIHQAGGGRWSFEKFEQQARNRKLRYWWGYYRNSFLVPRAALRICRTRRFDVAFVTDAEFMVAALLLWTYRKFAPPVVMQVSAANFSFQDYRGSGLKKAYKVLQREILRTVLGRQVQALSVLGQWQRERLAAQLRLPSSCPAVVTGDGGSQPPLVISRAEARRRLAIDFHGPILLFFGMLRRDKGIETLLGAVQRLSAEPFRLLIAGQPSEYSVGDIRKMLRSFGVENKVIAHLRYVDDNDIPLYFFSSQALMLPYNGSYRDGAGPLMKGACTYRLPVIASDVSEMGRLVRQHRFGLLCEPDSADALAAKIGQFLALPDAAREELGQRAAALARAHSWETLARKFSDLFQSIARPAAE